jgi:hypothetical protein
VRNEWWAVRSGLFLMGVFVAAALVTLHRVRRAAGQGALGPTAPLEGRRHCASA